MHRRCIKNGMMVSRVTVSEIMKHLGPIGVNTRRKGTLRRLIYYSQGSTWVWNLDGFGKFKPYGFEIHGCIDGYSRLVLLLSVIRSRKDPKEARNFYFNYLLIAKGVPRKIVTDRGTENVNIVGSQIFLRQNHSDNLSGYQSF